MTVKEIKAIARRMGLQAGKMKKADLIRTIQTKKTAAGDQIALNAIITGPTKSLKPDLPCGRNVKSWFSLQDSRVACIRQPGFFMKIDFYYYTGIICLYLRSLMKKSSAA